MYEHEGKQYARVTDILKPFTDFSHIDPEVLVNKARIGTNVHQAIADDIAGDMPCLAKDEMGYFTSYLRWKEEVSHKVTQTERRYYDEKNMVTGQIDALMDFGYVSGLPTLVDFKTSAIESKIAWPMQAHLYVDLLAQNGQLAHPMSLFIKLEKTGAMPRVYSYLWNVNTHLKCMDAIKAFWESQP